MTTDRLGSLLIIFLFLSDIAIATRTEPAVLNPIVYCLTIIAWLSIIILIRPTLTRPRIGALSERTFVAFAIAFLGTVASAIVYNTDHDRTLFDAQTAALLFRLAIVGILLIPAMWIVLYVTDKLGQGSK